MKNKKYTLLTTYISFIAIIVTFLSVIWSSFDLKTDLKLTTALLGIVASIFGALLSVFYKRVTTKKNRSKIFISYSFKDNDYANKIRKELHSERFILNIDENNILVGENIKDTLNKELDSSSIVIVLISKNSSNSEFTQYEIERAIKKGKKVLPILIDKEAKIPEILKNIQYADLTQDIEIGLNKLIKSLKHNLDESKPVHNTV